MENKLKEIVQYYFDNFDMCGQSFDDVYQELVDNGAEVHGDSFYCPIWSDELQAFMLMAGAKDKADIWMLKKFISFIKQGEKTYTVVNGNSDLIVPMLMKYDPKIIQRNNDITILQFN